MSLHGYKTMDKYSVIRESVKYNSYVSTRTSINCIQLNGRKCTPEEIKKYHEMNLFMTDGLM